MFEAFERFTGQQNLENHFKKHGKEFGNITMDDYEQLADDLQRTPVDNKRIFGYMSERDNRGPVYNKYDKDTEIMVIYRYNGNEPETITCFIRPWRKFNELRYIEYYDEIPAGK